VREVVEETMIVLNEEALEIGGSFTYDFSAKGKRYQRNVFIVHSHLTEMPEVSVDMCKLQKGHLKISIAIMDGSALKIYENCQETICFSGNSKELALVFAKP